MTKIEKMMKIAFIVREDGTSNENFHIEAKQYKKGEIIEKFGEKFKVVSNDPATVGIVRFEESVKF